MDGQVSKACEPVVKYEYMATAWKNKIVIISTHNIVHPYIRVLVLNNVA